MLFKGKKNANGCLSNNYNWTRLLSALIETLSTKGNARDYAFKAII